MNTNYRRIPTRFGRETRFEVKPVALRGELQAQFERLKNRLLQEHLRQAGTTQSEPRLRCAAHEAAALVWLTPFPLLLFPVLFEEKATLALAQAERQEQIRERSRELLAV